MTPLYSDADRARAIRKFIFARSKASVQVNSYEGIKDYLEEQRVEILCKLKKSGRYTKNSWSPPTHYYTEQDAKTYFEWLISVVTGTIDSSSDVYKKAINQLFMFIFNIDDTVDADEQVSLLTPYSLDEEIGNLDEKISQIRKKVEHMNEQIVNALEKILNWQQKYQPYLDRMVKDQDSAEKVLKGKRSTK